jgi:outer membrane protein assembly factor BamB
VTAYSLPDKRVLWKSAGLLRLLADGGELVVTSDANGKTNQLVAFDDKTGSRPWSVPGGEVCGITATQMLLAVNGQLAVIDLGSGKQVSYTTNTSTSGSDCPMILPGGIEVESGGNVRQVLTP